jgi:hypothetical protein
LKKVLRLVVSSAPLPYAQDLLSSSFNRIPYTTGQTIFTEGDPATHLYVVAAGRVKVLRQTPDGQDIVLDILLPGEFFGSLSMKIPQAIRLSKATLHNIRQNVVIALVTVFGLLAGVLLGEVTMAGGMFIHEASVLVVVLNGMRLLRA